jgi:putative SOS response-associated peptidase YedK
MCGRYELDIEEDELIRRFAIKRQGWDFRRRSNVAPSQVLPIITEEEPDRLSPAKWGLLPFWAKPDKPVNRPINAKSETVDQLPTFRNAFHERRCLVPATAFFEWQAAADGKQPYRICLASGEPFVFAGLYEERPAETEPERSSTILTTEPNAVMAPIHNRMPVILSDAAADHWLNPDTPPEQLKPLLQPYPAQAMSAYAISRLVNSPRNDTPEAVAPIAEKAA